MNRETLVNFYTKYRIVIFPLLVAFASIVLIVTLIYPHFRDFLEGQDKIKKEKARIFSLEAKAADLEETNERVVNKNLKDVLLALPTSQDFSSLVGIFQKLSVQAGVSLLSLQLGSSQIQIPGVSGFAVKMEVEGTPSALSLLLSNINKTSRSMKAEGVEVSRSQTGALSGFILVDIFYAPAPKDLGAIDKELPELSAEDEKLLEELVLSAPAPVAEITSLPARGKANPFE